MSKPKPTHVRLNNLPRLDRIPATTALLTCLGPVVYAIRTGDLIKIGHTTNLAKRAAVLGGYSNLLAWRPGTLSDEQAIHASLDGLAVRGREYYPADPRVLAVVNEMRNNLGLAATH